MSVIDDRRAYTDTRVSKLKEYLVESAKQIDGIACVYATGSFGRSEAWKYSDLDLFIVAKNKDVRPEAGRPESTLRKLDEICLKADLIKATRILGIPEFDGDGKYLVHYTIDDLKNKLGHPEDDADNTFTARLLLLLESRPLIGDVVYDEVVGDVIAAYWRDYSDHKGEFVPAFLANDIVRLWRTFCVNYEVRTERAPVEKNIRRRQKNYTLKHSRLLTCYSGLMFLLSIFALKKTVEPDDVREMVSLSPTERLEWMLRIPELADAQKDIAAVLKKYGEFLELKDDKDRFFQLMSDRTTMKELMDGSHVLSDGIFRAIQIIGEGNRLHRLLLV